MEAELSEFSRENKAKDLDISHNKHYYQGDDAGKRTVPEPQGWTQNLKVELRTVKAGLNNGSRFIQELKELKEATKELYTRNIFKILIK